MERSAIRICIAEERTDLRNGEGGVDEVSKTVSSISVVVPVYNSESILPALIKRLEPVLGAVCCQYRGVLVNDGSRDGSWEVIQELAARHGWVRGINLMRNYGQHNALLCGIRAARFETIVTMDDDLEHPPEEILNLLAKLEEGFDVVYGFPEQQQHGLLRDLASELTKLALRSSMGAETARHISAFRAFRTRAREAFADYHSPFVSIDVVLTWATTRFAAIQVRHDSRLEGVSNYTFRKLFTHAMNLMTGFSTLPLQVANLSGPALHGLRRIHLVVCHRALSVVRDQRARVHVSRLDHSHFFRNSTRRAGYHRGVSRADALPDDGTSDLHRARATALARRGDSMSAETEACCELLPWDTDFFSCRIGRVRTDTLANEQVLQIDEWSKDNHIRCLYFLARADDPATIRIAETHGFGLVDVRLTLERRVRPPRGSRLAAKPPPDAVIRPARPRGPPGLAGNRPDGAWRYAFLQRCPFPAPSGWRNSIRSGSPWNARVARKRFSSQPARPNSLWDISRAIWISTKQGRIGLVGVAREARGKGLGSSLVLAALDWFAAQGAKEIAVVTQGRNVPAQRLYQSLGFLTADLRLWYHKWYG